MGFRHVNDREPSFIAHLPGPHLTRSCRAFSTTFKTTVFSQRPLPWFRAFFRKTALEGQQTSISHAAPQSTRPPFHSRLASCVRVHKPQGPHRGRTAGDPDRHRLPAAGRRPPHQRAGPAPHRQHVGALIDQRCPRSQGGRWAGSIRDDGQAAVPTGFRPRQSLAAPSPNGG
jgi:hypothetical protein